MTITLNILPASFVHHWQTLCLRHRSTLRAHRELMRHLYAWRCDSAVEPIPGYDVPPPQAPGMAVPRGWSYANLCRLAPRNTQPILRADAA